jgi:hypothetical protein
MEGMMCWSKEKLEKEVPASLLSVEIGGQKAGFTVKRG